MATTVYFVVGDLQFEWDSDKAASNIEKHHLSFEEGANHLQGLGRTPSG